MRDIMLAIAGEIRPVPGGCEVYLAFKPKPILLIIFILVLPVYGWAVIAVSERTVLLWRAVRAWRGGRRGDVAGILDRDRAEVVAAVREAL